MTMRRTLVGLAALALLVPGAGNAQAEPESMAQGSVGAADLVLDGVPVTIDPIAQCEAGVVEQATSPGAEVPDFVEFDGGSTTCSFDETTEAATASVTGERFRLEGLAQYGGPRLIRLSSFTVTCETTATGSSANFRLSGLTGITVPSTIPPNHVVTIPGPAGAPPIATVTFNETLIPSPPDGSMTVNVMHVRLFPEGSRTHTTGDIVVGSVSCAPF
jgi:hypothetical protein